MMENNNLSVSEEDVARRLAQVWRGGVDRVLSQGLPAGAVARSLVAAGLELWAKEEGPRAVAEYLAGLATSLDEVSEAPSKRH